MEKNTAEYTRQTNKKENKSRITKEWTQDKNSSINSRYKEMAQDLKATSAQPGEGETKERRENTEQDSNQDHPPVTSWPTHRG